MKEYVQNYYKTKDKCVWEMAKKMRKFGQNVTYLALNFDRARSAFLTDVTYNINNEHPL